MNRLLPTLIAPLVLSSYCTLAAATQYITVIDPRTGAMHVAVVNGAIQTQSNPGGIVPAQQITMTPPNSSPHTQGKVDVIDLNELTNAATPQIIQAILEFKESIDRENAAFLEKQQQLQEDSRKTPDIATPPDLDKTAGTDPIGKNNKKPSVGQDRPVPPQPQNLQQVLQQIQQQQQVQQRLQEAQQQQQVQQDSRKTLDTVGRPDLDKMAEIFDNLIGNIVQKTIDEKKPLPEEANQGQLALLLARVEEQKRRLEAQNAGKVGKPSGDDKPTGTAFTPNMSVSFEEIAKYAADALHQANSARPESEGWWESYVASAVGRNLPKADMPEGANRSDVLAGTQGQYGTPSQQSLNQLEQSLTNAATNITTDPWASYIYVARNEATTTVPTASLYGSATGHYAGLVNGSLDGASVNGTLNMRVNFAPGISTISGSLDFGSQGSLQIFDGIREQTGVVGGLTGIAFGGQASGELSGKLFGPNAEQVGGEWGVNVYNHDGVTSRWASGQFVGGQVAPK